MAKSVSQWDASDLQALIGQEETSSLEFKRSDALDNTDGNKRELVKDVSAMANAAGGVIVYGIEEKDNLADALDQGTMQTKEWIDQVLTSNIEPKIPNVTIQRIPLASGCFAFALDIPMAVGLAPHQAKPQKQYFRRYNNTALAMLDHEIRDLMRRSAAPELFVDFAITPPHADASTIRATIGNRAQEPALYTRVSLIFERNLFGEQVVVPWARSNKILRAMSQTTPVVVLTRNYTIQTEMPIFAGVDLYLLQAGVTIPPDSVCWIGYQLDSPGCNVRSIGRLVRAGMSQPQIEYLGPKFDLE